jgi:hypothetical protein
MRLLFAILLVLLALVLVAFVLFVRPAWSAPRCLTYAEQTLGRLQAVCDDGTRAVSTYNQTFSHRESTLTPPLGKTCAGQMNLRTRLVEVHCR